MEMRRYENSSPYRISEEAIAAIAENMRENGFDPDFPILVKDGGILDGWHRYQAAQRAGVEPQFREFTGDEKDALRFIMRANGDRRHLNAGERASAAILINRQLGTAAEKMAAVAEVAGVKESTANRLSGYSDEELQDIADGKATQADVKERNSKGPRQQLATYTLTRQQSAKVASLVVELDERGKVLLRKAMDLGLKALEEQVAAMSQAK